MEYLNDKGVRKKYDFFYVVVNVPINDQNTFHIVIFERGTYEVHPFTRFLKDNINGFTLRDKALNTIKNFYLTYIIRFLNYIYNESSTPINNIEDLKLEMVQEFLDIYAQGNLKSDREKRWKDSDSVDRATHAISYFVYWLWSSTDRVTNKRIFKMKNFKSSDFKFSEVMKYNKKSGSYTKVKSLIDIVTPNTNKTKRERFKVVNASDYLVSKLIELAKKNDPMMSLGIVLGAYSGLRIGELTQLYEGRIKGLSENETYGIYFDFTYDTILRSDNKITGNIKTKRSVPVYPGCSKYIYQYYQEHLKLLSYKGLYPNKYGALFIDNNGMAMTTQTYNRRFRKLNDLLDKAIKEEVIYGNYDAIKEEKILCNNKITPHSLRHFYKQLLEDIEGNERAIQFFLAHKSLKSQQKYGFADVTKDKIRECENRIFISIESLKNK